MSQFAPAFLTIHILTAIVAFGPSFAFPLISGLAAKEPQHGLFAVRLIDLMERRLVLPAALTMPVSGALLVWSERLDLLATHWLLAAISLYVVAIVFAFAVQLQTIDRMLEVATGMAARPLLAAAAAGAGAGAAPEGAALLGGGASIPRRLVMGAGPGAQLATPPAGGPPPGTPGAEMAALGVRARNGGIFLSLLVVAIVTLMASKPGF
jgi:uncharacterized membrane protein